MLQWLAYLQLLTPAMNWITWRRRNLKQGRERSNVEEEEEEGVYPLPMHGTQI